MNSLPNDQPKPKALAPDTTRRIQRIKNGLVLQVALKDGQFWNEVREIRTRWGVVALDQLPPKDPNLFYTEQLLPSTAELTGKYIVDGRTWDVDIKGLWLWLAVPGLEQYRLDVDWWPFMSALVLFQPPLDHLLDFAEYGEIVRKDPYAEYGKTLRNDPEFRRKEAATSHDPTLVNPLISKFPNPYSLERAQQDYYEALIEEINKRFLKPRGLDIDEMRDEVLNDGTLDESLQERLRQIPQDLYIRVPNNATVDELRPAVGLAVSMLEESEKAEAKEVEAPETLLIQVELAYRYHHLKQSFPDLPEGRYPSIGSAETYKKYAQTNRKLLDKVTSPSE